MKSTGFASKAGVLLRWLAAGLTLVVLTACHESAPVGEARSYAHANGLRLSASTAYSVAGTPEGFFIGDVSNKVRRSPIEVSIRLLTARPEVAAYQEYGIGFTRRIRYLVTHETEGGSGGVDYTLVAVEDIGAGRWILYRQIKQSEGQPRFELWEMAGGLSFPPA